MNKEKQIEEMAILIAAQKGYGCNEKDRCDMSCQVFKVGCIPYEAAQILYNAGYRKQIEVAREIISEFKTTVKNRMLKLGIYTAVINRTLELVEKKLTEKYTEEQNEKTTE